MVSIIIPVLNEEKCIEGFLNHLQQFKGLSSRPSLPKTALERNEATRFAKEKSEIIIVDGGSEDKTKEIVSRFDDVTIVSSRRGRARQMNAGAKVANGNILLFLHADTYLPENAIGAVEEIIRNGADGGCFSLKVDSSLLLLRIASRLMTLKTRLTRVATGDQTIFVRRSVFDELGGYADIPLMEDLDFTRRLKKRRNFVELDLKVSTSSRRFQKWGVYKTILLMGFLMTLYYIGIPPQRLVEFYQDVR